LSKFLFHGFNKRAFSLLELILVLFLVGLMAGLTTPFLLSTLERIKSQSSVRELATSLRYARSLAITQKTPFAFNVNMDNNRYWLTDLETEEPRIVKELDPGIKVTRFSDKEETIIGGTFFIIFYPQGNSSGGSISIESKNPPGKSFFITLDSITGKPHVDQET